MSMPDPNSIDPSARQAVAGVAKWWWLLLITGALWLIIGGIVLQMDAQSLATVGYLVGFMLIFTGIEQFMVASAVIRVEVGVDPVRRVLPPRRDLGRLQPDRDLRGPGLIPGPAVRPGRHLLVHRGVRHEGLQPASGG